MKRTAVFSGALFAIIATARVSTVAASVEIDRVELHVADLSRSRKFFTEALNFKQIQDASLPSSSALLALGDERLVLQQVPLKELAPPPPAANVSSFQHIAIVVSNMEQALERVASAGAVIVSSGPVRFSDANYAAKEIRALYFRDPDGHFLELIAFPSDKGEPRWHSRNRPLFLGIDHTAIAVQNRSQSMRFYRDALGMTLAGDSHNRGTEQSRLNGVPGSDVQIVSLRGSAGLGLELLEFVAPPLRQASSRVTDWRIHVLSSRSKEPHFLDDPDGHRLTIVPNPHSRLDYAWSSLRTHGKWYAIEAALLGTFMVISLWMTLLLEHPASPLRRCLPNALVRRALMGVVVGLTVFFLLSSSWGHQSGAHFNPAVTWSFFQQRMIQPWDAFFYVIAQFLGGWIGLAFAGLPFRKASRHVQVNYIVTQPGKTPPLMALAAEFTISFLLLATLLEVRWTDLKPWTPVFAGGLLFLYITFESPLSGMSLNPARTVASALCAGQWRAIALYFAGPLAGMSLAAYLCRMQ